MSTKMKGLLKGLRYISQIFDEEKEAEMQIGFPTDVKHVAHIGWDGPSVDSPSWMNEYKSPTAFQSAPLSSPGDPREDPEIKWVSQDSRRGSRAITNSPSQDLPELPKSSRRHSSSENNTNESPKKKDSSTKSRQPRRNQSKESSDASLKSNRQLQESSLAIDSPPRNLPDIPKKSRRKKSKESITGGGSSRPRSKGTTTNGTLLDVPPCSDSGHDNCSILQMPGSELISSTSSSKPVIQDDREKESSVISKEY